MTTPRLCSVEGCDKPAKKRGWCQMHYGRWLRHGDLSWGHQGRAICAIEGCRKYAYGHGWCSKHYQRWVRNGDPLAGRISGGEPLKWLENILTLTSDECIPWPFAKNPAGYGILSIGAGNVIVSRFVCERTHGPAPIPNCDTAHSCSNPPCCNSKHVRWDTRAGNMADAIARGTTLRGPKHPNVKLSIDDVRSIRRKLETTSQTALALEYRVSRSLVSAIKRRTRWAWLVD